MVCTSKFATNQVKYNSNKRSIGLGLGKKETRERCQTIILVNIFLIGCNVYITLMNLVFFLFCNFDSIMNATVVAVLFPRSMSFLQMAT